MSLGFYDSAASRGDEDKAGVWPPAGPAQSCAAGKTRLGYQRRVPSGRTEGSVGIGERLGEMGQGLRSATSIQVWASLLLVGRPVLAPLPLGLLLTSSFNSLILKQTWCLGCHLSPTRQESLSDFCSSRSFPGETSSHCSECVRGSPETRGPTGWVHLGSQGLASFTMRRGPQMGYVHSQVFQQPLLTMEKAGVA